MHKKEPQDAYRGLYHPSYEHDSCGVGFVANVNGKREHAIVEKGIRVLENLVHRGAIGGDMKTGDGAGMLFQMPHTFFDRAAEAVRINLPRTGEYGVAMVFLSRDEAKAGSGVELTKKALSGAGLTWLGMREVPTDPSCLGWIAAAGMPRVTQIFAKGPGLSGDGLERRLYLARRMAENQARAAGLRHGDYYICSFSSRTIIYKGLLVAHQIKQFYPDLGDSEFESSMALVHQRYSTNTFPTWPLAQPFRYIAHNGEINTLRGNVNKMQAREYTMSSPHFGEDLTRLYPICDPEGSDSAIFDNVFELLVNNGRSMEHAMMMMVPEAFGIKYHISEDKRAFYEYHANFMEPWDGPAALVFTDGRRIGATLDRNGLRPCRFTLTKDGFLVLASECGVLDIPADQVQKKGRLMPGKMFLVDTVQGRFLDDLEIKAHGSRQKPYRHWLEKNRIELSGMFATTTSAVPDQETILRRQVLFGYTYEDVENVIVPMAVDGQEPVSSMGADASLAVLNEKPQLLFNYFKQLFAQVTNPPIDPIREGLVMSLMSFLGRDHNLLEETPEHCRKLKLPHPILTNEDLDRIKQFTHPHLTSALIPMLFPAQEDAGTLENALAQMFQAASRAIKNGANILILSDRGADREKAPIPCLLASAGLHHHLIRAGERGLVGIILESGEPREVMHSALLVGYGVNAINPYLAFETIALLCKQGALGEDVDEDKASGMYITSVKKGLLKIFSKMGISTLRSYHSAQIFEAVGLNSALIDRYFTNTPSRIEGIGLKEIQKEAMARHRRAFDPRRRVDSIEIGGMHRVRGKSPNHLWNPLTISLLHKATQGNSYEVFKQYTRLIDEQAGRLCTLRGLFKLKKSRSVPLEEVEPVSAVVKRFATGGMSFGSISREAHESLAVAMNRLGAKSNTGEGGEESERSKPRADGDSARSAIKQVASARFGVTTEYMISADELQIKIAQGAKPGEGGQLPGHKVDKTIGRVRYSTPGVTLISPPPHHDIYSIEDLAQLIYDLRSVNPRARISVKLVAEAGVGTVAAGVAKAKADLVLISGHDGGTGASPMSSILHAGVPWELGLAETQQTLTQNHLRDKIRVQVDGQLKTGRDVVIAALLGAEEFGFATMPLVSLGCVMMRKCHKNTCPVGVATQDPRLRARFTGKPEYVVNLFTFIAREVREIMGELGFRTMDEMIGHVEMLEVDRALHHWKTQGLDFSRILYQGHMREKNARLRCTTGQRQDFSGVLDKELLERCRLSLDKKEKTSLTLPIRNSHRTVGAALSGEIARKYGGEGLPDDTIQVTFKGSAGQSFGAFLTRGVTFRLEGEANDYLGKSLSGGKIIVVPPAGSTFRPEHNIIVGNTLLYGATQGEVYIRGMAGERFAVRNSGAGAVVEGMGDHGCEYMTGGTVVVLGATGRNFAAGMSGGIAYALDENQLFDTLCNLDMVDIEPVVEHEDIDTLHAMIEKHILYTGSGLARYILKNWREILPRFVKVMPMDYKKALAGQRLEENRDTHTVSVTEEVFVNNG
jgi:glutamate synthase domain-containing protein 2/glutamate synthase domain-containing protein 1/glutamate synthase domain-containing protein 3